MMDIRVFHRYNQLVEDGLVKPLRCSCGEIYTTAATEHADPLLRCLSCDTIVQPGLRLYEQVRAVVKEHFA